MNSSLPFLVSINTWIVGLYKQLIVSIIAFAKSGIPSPSSRERDDSIYASTHPIGLCSWRRKPLASLSPPNLLLMPVQPPIQLPTQPSPQVAIIRHQKSPSVANSQSSPHRLRECPSLWRSHTSSTARSPLSTRRPQSRSCSRLT